MFIDALKFAGGVLLLPVFFAILPSYAESSADNKISDFDESVYIHRMIPAPKSVKFASGNFKIAEGCAVDITLTTATDVDALAEKTSAIFKKYWSVSPKISVSADTSLADGLPSDGYRLEVSSAYMKIFAADEGGIFNALKTARQLAESERGKPEISAYILPNCSISDFPSMRFRGIHICHFPETTFYELERAVRLAAYYKMNYVVVEFWGTYPFRDHPELSWEDKSLSRSQIRKLVATAKELGITLIPQLNMLGHASASTSRGGKHSTLYNRKDLQNHFEHTGWSWCISNPDTVKMLDECMIDLHETFGNPPFFHVGFDESYDVGTCALCRSKGSRAELVKNRILHLRDVMKARNARIIMWHDMLINGDDKRWAGYIACGRSDQKLDTLVDTLPSDIVIADWQYGYPQKKGAEPTWETSKFFKSKGFDVIVCPWTNRKGTASLGRFAKNEKIFGLLGTTWGKIYSTPFCKIYTDVAEASWNGDGFPNRIWEYSRECFNRHVLETDWDMDCSKYEDNGYTDNLDLR